MDVDELIGLARDLAEEIVGAASELLLAGNSIEHVHRHYVVVAIELLADAESQAVLAAGSDRGDLAELERIASVLSDLRDKARAEADPSRG